MNITATLRPGKQKSPKRLIYLIYRKYGKQHQFPTAMKVDEIYWDSVRHRVVDEHPNHKSINDHINMIEEKIIIAITAVMRDGKRASVTNVKNYYSGPRESKDMIGLLKDYTDTRRNESDHRTVRAMYNVMISYTAAHGDIELDRMDAQFYDKFINALFSGAHTKNKRSITNNTASQYMLRLKKFCDWAVEKGLQVNPAYVNFQKWTKDRFSILEKERQILKEDEIKKMIEFKDHKNMKEATFHKVWIFQLYTSLRYSDVYSLKWAHIDLTERRFKKVAQKSSRSQLIGLSDGAMSIIENQDPTTEYVFQELHSELLSTSNTQANTFIKRVANYCGLDRKVIIATKSKKEVVEKEMELWMTIDTHTARHNYATYYLEKHRDGPGLQAILGHKSYKTTSRYGHVMPEATVNRSQDVF